MTPAKNIFICYRRRDAGQAGRIYDRLNARFRGRIFRDVDAIPPSADFTYVIRDKLGQCGILNNYVGRWTYSNGVLSFENWWTITLTGGDGQQFYGTTVDGSGNVFTVRLTRL